MQLTREQKRDLFIKAIGPALVAAALCAGAGSTFQAHVDRATADKLAQETATERQRERDTFADREKHLTVLIDTERKEHARDAEQMHSRNLGFARNTGRMRSNFETLLADARRSTADCTTRVDAIAESVGELVNLAGEGDELLRAAAAENEGLRAENRKLAEQVHGLQQFAKGPERVTVTASKR